MYYKRNKNAEQINTTAKGFLFQTINFQAVYHHKFNIPIENE